MFGWPLYRVRAQFRAMLFSSFGRSVSGCVCVVYLTCRQYNEQIHVKPRLNFDRISEILPKVHGKNDYNNNASFAKQRTFQFNAYKHKCQKERKITSK